jgi:hypothetical protein
MCLPSREFPRLATVRIRAWAKMSVMLGCLGIGCKRAHPSLHFAQGCPGAAVKTAAGLNRVPLGLNGPRECFQLCTLFVIAAPSVAPSPRTGQETRCRFANCPIPPCGGNRDGAMCCSHCDGWCQRRLGSLQALYKSRLPRCVAVQCHSSPTQRLPSLPRRFYPWTVGSAPPANAPKERRPLRRCLFDQG